MKSNTVERGRKGQIFSLDVLITLVPIIMLIGASAQYVFSTEQEAKHLSRQYELEFIARSALNNALDEAAREKGTVNRLAPMTATICDDLNNKVIAAMDNLAPDYEYYLDVRRADSQSYPGHVCDALGVETWSTGDETTLLTLTNSTGSWSRVLLTNDISSNPGNLPVLTEFSLIIWK